ncbi:MAG TPA: F0F1 ATP synthase subunit epsilon [Nitriliruptoraceae bacterium]|nr:F0F1 ATP synthase subunit epsilon [Nitriliruptoraceae bacterium]
MADPTFHVEIVSAEKSLLSVEATAVFARSLEGEIGILPGHQPALLALDIAPLTVVSVDEGTIPVAVHNGFLYYSDDELVVLADIAELASDIDPDRARAERERLEREEDREEAIVDASFKRQSVRLSLVE